MRSLKFVLAAALIVGGVAAGSVVLALWTSSGTGSGNAKALSAVTVTVTASTGVADLYPGFTGGKVFFTLTNANPYPVSFASMTSGAVTSSDQTNCPASNVTVGTASSLSLPVAANATSAQLSIANVVSMASAAPDGCQGVVFTVALTLAGSQT